MTGAFGTEAARGTAGVIRDRIGGAAPEVAIILGSGLGRLADRIADRVVVPYADVPGFPPPTVVGHSGSVVAGDLGGRRVVALSGRFHMYEGHGAELAGFPVRVLHELGARTLVVTNAAGGLRRTFRPGDIMLIRDHMNLTFRNPLIGAVEQGEERFPDMSDPYDPALLRLARDVAKSQGTPLAEGVYCALLGPAYETPAEVKMLTTLGADAVGMSTVPEVIVARARGMRVLGFSCITNLACGLSDSPITHAEVLETTLIAGDRMSALVAEIIRRLPA
ncbi:MAG TPA: purine-nucleoside phosphorylase [Gemmatimonadaceae bacterium]|nr:purine-nucleoside phosphorylase [Gemmatimonadaceae bacterium]